MLNLQFKDFADLFSLRVYTPTRVQDCKVKRALCDVYTCGDRRVVVDVGKNAEMFVGWEKTQERVVCVSWICPYCKKKRKERDYCGGSLVCFKCVALIADERVSRDRRLIEGVPILYNIVDGLYNGDFELGLSESDIADEMRRCYNDDECSQYCDSWVNELFDRVSDMAEQSVDSTWFYSPDSGVVERLDRDGSFVLKSEVEKFMLD